MPARPLLADAVIPSVQRGGPEFACLTSTLGDSHAGVLSNWAAYYWASLVWNLRTMTIPTCNTRNVGVGETFPLLLSPPALGVPKG